MSSPESPSPARLRAAVSPVSERFAAFTLGDAVVVFDRDEPNRWICAETAVDRVAMR